MNKQVDMEAFVGVDFDCVFFDFDHTFPRTSNLLGRSSRGCWIPSEGMESDLCRPRLNKPQAVKDGQISWIPDGLVWNAFGEYPDYCGGDSDFFSLEVIRSQRLRDVLAGYAIWIECIGAEPDYTEWANAHGVPVVEVAQ